MHAPVLQKHHVQCITQHVQCLAQASIAQVTPAAGPASAIADSAPLQLRSSFSTGPNITPVLLVILLFADAASAPVQRSS